MDTRYKETTQRVRNVSLTKLKKRYSQGLPPLYNTLYDISLYNLLLLIFCIDNGTHNGLVFYTFKLLNANVLLFMFLIILFFNFFFLFSWIIPDTTVEVCIDKLIEAVNDLGEKEKMHLNKVKQIFYFFVKIEIIKNIVGVS